MDVEWYSIESQSLNLLEDIEPKIWNRQSVGVEFAREYIDPLAVN